MTHSDAEAIIACFEELTSVLDVVTGYRKRAEEAGFSPAAAEAMAVQAHALLISRKGAAQ